MDPEYEQLWREKKCWECEIELNRVKDSSWICPKCSDKYYNCFKCEKIGEYNWDWIDNDKGMFCRSCSMHFCILCWQSSGLLIRSIVESIGEENISNAQEEILSSYDEDDYICLFCEPDLRSRLSI